MPDSIRIAAIVLAAGASRRFGSDKLLYPVTLNGVTLPLAGHSLMPWFEAFGHVTVVIRPDAEAFCRVLETALGVTKRGRIRWIVCADAELGMAYSLTCGVRANRAYAGWLVGLADMPAVPSTAIAAVRKTLLSGAELAAPYFDGRRGHPVGFSSRYQEELLALQGDTGARSLIEREITNVVQVKTDNDGIFSDIDTPGDLQHLVKNF